MLGGRRLHTYIFSSSVPANLPGNICVEIPRIAKTFASYNQNRAAFSKRAGGCNFAYDPEADARYATPHWINTEKKQIQLTAVDDDAENRSSFELWQLPGRKCLTHDGACLCASVQTARQTIHLRLGSNVASGKRFGYLLTENGRITESLQAIATLSALYNREKADRTSAVFDRPARSTVYHFRALQALDGVSVGASQREIAAVLVGEAMAETEWSADSALRAHIRALIQRGHRLRNGGYRQLLGAHRAQAQGALE